MSLQEDIRQAFSDHRKASNVLVNATDRQDVLTIGLMITGLSQGLEDALALIAEQVEGIAQG